MSSSSNSARFYAPANAFCIQVQGTDATRILNNLTTNSLDALGSVGSSVEVFVTNDKGWALAHGLVVRPDENSLWLTGQHSNPSLLCEHIDKYIIMEDAEVSDLTPVKSIYLIHHAEMLATDAFSASSEASIVTWPFVGDAKWLITEKSASPLAADRHDETTATYGSDEEFELLRIKSFWPMMGREIRAKSIPQELGRDSAAISFTKGCYLGQETIARLDARGSLQKKLCLLQIEGTELPDCESDLHLSLEGSAAENKPAGSLTSVASDETHCWALGYVRRGHYDTGSELWCGDRKVTVQPLPSSLSADS